MEKRMNKITRLSLFFCLVVSVFASATWAQGPDESYALLVQQSPPDGGSVTPGSGVHKMGIGDTVSLSAIPKSGYRFLYWLGDVSSTGTSDTTIQIDSPKMVVAVFAREEHDEELSGLRTVEGSGGGGGSSRGGFYNPVQRPGAANPGAYFYYNPGDVIYNFPDSDEDPTEDVFDDDIPVPGEPGSEVPEPATILMMGLGAAAFLRRKRK